MKNMSQSGHFFLFLIFWVSAYDVSRLRSMNLDDPGDEADIYFPDNAGDQIFPVVLLLPESNLNKESYSEISIQIAAKGYIVTIPQHKSSDLIIPKISLLPNSLIMLSTLNKQMLSTVDKEMVNPLYDKVDLQKIAIIGHGVGGLIGIISASKNGSKICTELKFCQEETDFPAIPELTAVITYGTDLIAKPGIELIKAVPFPQISINLFSGTLDGISSVKSAKISYDKLLEGPKSRWVCEGLNHYSITNDPITELQGVSNEIIPFVENIKQLGKIFALILNGWLKDDDTVITKFYEQKELPTTSPLWLSLAEADKPAPTN